MSQDYDDIAAADSLSSSLAKIESRDDALLTLHSGTSAPSTTSAYMWWADTTNGLLKIRNAADDGWVTVGTLADSYLGLNNGKSGLGYLTATVDASSTGDAVMTEILNVGGMISLQEGLVPNDTIRIDEDGTYEIKVQFRHNGSINSGLATVALTKNGSAIITKQENSTTDRDVEMSYIDEFVDTDEITIDVSAGAFLTTAGTTFLSVRRVK